MSRLDEIGEFGLIDRIAKVTPGAANVVEGIGDDCAVVRVGDRVVLLSCDLSVEDVHFRRRYASPEDIGWKAAASAVSDIAAMGGRPLFLLVALACPKQTSVDFLEGIYKGIQSVARQFHIAVVGGDTTRSLDHIALDVTVVGEPVNERWMLRSGAKAGDVLVVTGPLGLSSAGHRALDRGEAVPIALANAHLRPMPRIAEGQWLSAQAGVHAMMDISDGLLQDAAHISKRSNVGVDIKRTMQVCTTELRTYCDAQGLSCLDFCLAGGEDYELLFAVEQEKVLAIFTGFAATFGRDLHTVGVCTNEFNALRLDGCEPLVKGFDHFRS
jgi:thiamine-monophosphate kinase